MATWQTMAEPDFLVPIDWSKWEADEERMARRAPFLLRNGIIWRREELANPGTAKSADPDSRYFLHRTLSIMEGIAARLGVVV